MISIRPRPGVGRYCMEECVNKLTDEQLFKLGKMVKVVTSDHEEWEERRVRWNRFSDEVATRLIAVPSTVDDVVKIVSWAREEEQTDLGVRAGGHGYFSTAQVVIDMRDGFDYASIDEETGVATIGMGQTLGALDERTHPWHVPVGVVSHTGTGLLLTGGVGYLCKAHGASADNIKEVTIVTSDGKVRVCSEENESDLFFAVRGAAPNLGVVTEVKMQAYKQADALCSLRAWPLTKENTQRLFEWADQPDVLNDPNITPYIALIPTPDAKGRLVALHAVCVSPAEDDEQVKGLLAQLDGTGETVLLPASRVPWSVPQTIFDEAFASQHWYVTQTYFPGDETIPMESFGEAIKAFTEVPLTAVTPLLVYEQRGNSSSRYHQVPSEQCAQPRYGQRWEAYLFVGASDPSHAEDTRKWGRVVKSALLDSGGASPGGRCHLTKDEPSRVEFYYGPNSERVREVVAKYDPARLFASCNGMEF
jgi:FAD/FMN-containing dehydrogenase